MPIRCAGALVLTMWRFKFLIYENGDTKVSKLNLANNERLVYTETFQGPILSTTDFLP
jgi:hypothetical protein